MLLENKINIKGNILIFVKSKRFKIIKFLKKRANFNEKLYNIMRQNQFKPSYKEKKADYIIINNFKNRTILKEILSIKNKLNKSD